MSAQELIVVPRARSTGYEASIVIPGEANARVEWRTNLDALPGAADDLLLPLALLPAMRIGFDLRIEAEISARLLDSVESLQRLYWSWDRSLRLVDVHAERTVRPSTGQRAGAFFSGGVDSFHTALRHRSTLDSLIWVCGFDIHHQRYELLTHVTNTNRRAAAQLGLKLTEVVTDLRDFSSPYLGWSEYHGAALAAAAHLCGFAQTYVPGSLSVDSTFPYGSHPDLDPMYSSEVVSIYYDGYETNRVNKTIDIAHSDVALESLRVCNSRDDAGYNCGRCEKCLRTLVALRIAGRPADLPTFPVALDLTELSGRRFRQGRALWRQNLAAAVRCGDLELAEAINASLRRPWD